MTPYAKRNPELCTTHKENNMSGYIPFSQIDELLAQRKDIYIRNKGTYGAARVKPIVILNYPSAEGTRSFNVPRTSIPFNICNHVDPESLRSSASFRKLLNNGVLEIVATEQAELELADPAKQQALKAALYEADSTTIYNARSDEIKKNKEAEASIKAEKQREQSAGMKNMIQAMDPQLAQALNLLRPDGQVPDPVLERTGNPRFIALENRAKSGSMTGPQVVSELTLMYGDLTMNELQAVATGSAWPVEAQQWARERMAYQIEALNKKAALSSPTEK